MPQRPVAALWLLLALALLAKAGAWPTLTTARQAHSLTYE
jgi:formate hydrogenlyase subunit 3/multisubunit Na+/H+ antiporter MnhD subunit